MRSADKNMAAYNHPLAFPWSFVAFYDILQTFCISIWLDFYRYSQKNDLYPCGSVH